MPAEDDRVEFTSGAVRDKSTGKPRYDLIPPGPLRRLAMVYARGAEKYSPYNWAKGMPTSRLLESAMRHLEQYRLGHEDEDHLGHCVFNLLGLMHFQGTEWDDVHDWDSYEPKAAS